MLSIFLGVSPILKVFQKHISNGKTEVDKYINDWNNWLNISVNCLYITTCIRINVSINILMEMFTHLLYFSLSVVAFLVVYLYY